MKRHLFFWKYMHLYKKKLKDYLECQIIVISWVVAVWETRFYVIRV